MGAKAPLEAGNRGEETSAVQGVLWALLASLALTVMLLLVKLLGDSVPVGQTLLIRQTTIVLLLLPFIAPRLSRTFATDRLGLHLLRAGLAAIAMLAGYTAVAHLPLADFTALSFSRAFFLTILAVLFLKEVVGLRRWSGTVLGFVGVLLILGPGTASFSPYALLALLGAFATALIFAIVRSLTVSETPLTIMSYQAIFVGVLVLPIALMDWTPLSGSQWMLAGAIGGTGLFAQVASIRALKAAPASLVAPTDYTRLVWAMILGFLLFSELPSLKSALGAIVIVLSALWVLTEKKNDKGTVSGRS
ncbi:MAG: DMT family transporter [Hyphomicrobiaceae bacterium]